MTAYTVTFARIGRTHDVPVLNAAASDADGLADQIHRYARPYLLSRDVVVHVDLGKMRGWIVCGFHNGGDFTIAESGGTS